MSTVSNTVSLNVVSDAAPTWFTNQTVSTWSTPVTNTISAVTPSPQPSGSTSAICLAWTGGCVDQSRGEFILAANGGHGDYAGNEVYACDLRSESPQWTRLADPTPNATVSASGDDAYNSNELYADGHPRSMHGWNRCVWGNGRVWYGGMAGTWPGGRNSTACVSWDRDSVGSGPFPVSAAASPWAFHGRIAMPGIIGSDVGWQLGNAVYDPVTKRIWAGAQFSNLGQQCYYVQTDDVSPAPVAIDITHAGAFHSWGVIPHNLGRIWVVKDQLANRFMLLDLTNPTSGWQARNVPSLSSFGAMTSYGAVYHVGTQSIYAWHGNGSSVVRITVPNDPWTGTFTASLIGGAGGATPSAPASAGTFSRFNIIQNMGNGQSALVLVNSISQPVYVYKLPTS